MIREVTAMTTVEQLADAAWVVSCPHTGKTIAAPIRLPRDQKAVLVSLIRDVIPKCGMNVEDSVYELSALDATIPGVMFYAPQVELTYEDAVNVVAGILELKVPCRSKSPATSESIQTSCNGSQNSGKSANGSSSGACSPRGTKTGINTGPGLPGSERKGNSSLDA